MGLLVSNFEVENTGIVLSEVYLKITSVTVSFPSGFVGFNVNYFKSKADADNNKQHIGVYTNGFILSDKNGDVREQIYLYIKTLPTFLNAIDEI